MCVYTNLVETRQKEGWKRSMEQWQNKKFRVFFILTLAAGIGLAAEGIVFSYSIWKRSEEHTSELQSHLT